MTEGLVVEQVRKLVELQTIDAQIYHLKKELKEKPALLQKLKEEFENKKIHLKELEDKHKTIQVARKGQEGELQAQEEAIAKSNMQLSQIKTNKEYTAKITEIENVKADKSRIEEKILMSYDEADQMKAEIDKEKGVIADEEKKYQAIKKEMEDSIKEYEARIKVLEEDRKKIIPDIEKVHIERYEKILENKEGLAIVPVQGYVCGGCFMNVPAQVINEIKMHDKLIYCELCSRILYLEEDIENK